MYDKAICKCPDCQGKAIMNWKISGREAQEYDMGNWQDIAARLSMSDLLNLYTHCVHHTFQCENCGKVVSPLGYDKHFVAKALFGRIIADER